MTGGAALDRPAFWTVIRAALFGGHMTQSQVDGLRTILAYLAALPALDLRFVAYMLATAFHETGATMMPIAEVGEGAGRAYGASGFWGRGYVQLTWLRNYQFWAHRLGLDLIGHPELALTPAVALPILVDGMLLGSFTGRKLGDYFSLTKTDPVAARAIINGTDCAAKIAGYHRSFLTALQAP